MDSTIIDYLYSRKRELLDYLAANGEVSFQSDVDGDFRRVLLLSAASFFENALRDILLTFFREKANSSELVIRFIENKAIERQYHTYFSWRDTNANSFFGLFGDGFRNFMKEEVRKDKQLEDGIRAFLKLGNARNELVHENFAVFPLETTADEVYELYRQASFFVETLPRKLREYTADAESKS